MAWELWLVYDYLCKLRSIGWQGNIVETGRRFKRLYERENLKDLANFLDHEAEYIARGLDYDFEVQGGGEDHVRSIKVFGIQYRVREAIDSALELREPLQTFMASI